MYCAPLPAERTIWPCSIRCFAVEVISPSSARYDRGIKRRAYQRAGTAEYWIVDPDARIVERWRPGDTRPEVLLDRLTWQPRLDQPPMPLDVERLFRDA